MFDDCMYEFTLPIPLKEGLCWIKTMAGASNNSTRNLSYIVMREGVLEFNIFLFAVTFLSILCIFLVGSLFGRLD